ncbi:hypothetical protein [Emticicia sp. 17c]|uniref:hypothetical protein n=1 Tax=Emticicia sp. 17c TaxID=3127704 RepID=UPI00301DE666
MEKVFLRLSLISFLTLCFGIYTMGQTTVTLPTIPCSTCNGPGSFTISSPTCGGGQVTSPLTLSWAAATGASSYTVMIATDANFTQNLAITSVTGTSLSIPSVALKASTFYYWTVIANSASGSTKASSNCQFVTDATFTSTTPTGGFPAGSPDEKGITDFLASGSMSCQKGDGTCASGDNLVCNPKFSTYIQGGGTYTPYWTSGATGQNGFWGISIACCGSSLSALAQGPPPSGTQSAGIIQGNNSTQTAITPAMNYIWPSYVLSAPVYAVRVLTQPMVLTNSKAVADNYQLSFYGKGGGSVIGGFVSRVVAITGNLPSIDYFYATPTQTAGYTQRGTSSSAVTTSTSSWSLATTTISFPAGFTTSAFFLYSPNASADIYITDLRVCKL